MLRSFYIAPGNTQQRTAGTGPTGRVPTRTGEGTGRIRTDTEQIKLWQLVQPQAHSQRSAVCAAERALIAGPHALPFIPQEEAFSAPFLPLLTLNSEYWFVEFWNFPLDHGPEVLFQLVVVLLEFLLVFPLVCCDEAPVFLYGLTTPEMHISGWGENEVLFQRSLKCLKMWGDDLVNLS